MKKYDVILFDLDGTITDPEEGITKSVQYALSKFGIDVSDRTLLYPFIGPPLKDAFMELYNFSEADAMMAIKYYRERYEVKGLFENIPYEGIDRLLESLVNKGKKLIVATSKPEKFAVEIMKHFDLAKYFTYIAGAAMDESRNTKSAVIEYALQTCGITDTASVLMVGDRKYDVIGARQMSMDCAGVLYGYGTEEEMREAAPAYICATIDELDKLIV